MHETYPDESKSTILKSRNALPVASVYTAVKHSLTRYHNSQLSLTMGSLAEI